MNKFSPSLKIVSLVALLVILPLATFSHAAEHEDDHEHEHADKHLCACEAKEFGFMIDCSKAAAVTDAADYLKANTCTTAKTKECEKNFLILQSHHDFCPHDTLPSTVENDLHVYEGSFKSCSIPRDYDSKLGMCPAFDCDAIDMSSKLTAAATYLTTNCDSTCASDNCTAAFQSILMAHDTCDEDKLPGTVETTLHDFEEKCEDALCNSLSNAYNLNTVTCPEEAVSSAPPRGGRSIGHVLALALAVAGSSAFVFL